MLAPVVRPEGAQMGVWAAISVYIDSAERLRGWARWAAGAAIWLAFGAICVAPLALAYACGRAA